MKPNSFALPILNELTCCVQWQSVSPGAFSCSKYASSGNNAGSRIVERIGFISEIQGALMERNAVRNGVIAMDTFDAHRAAYLRE